MTSSPTNTFSNFQPTTWDPQAYAQRQSLHHASVLSNILNRTTLPALTRDDSMSSNNSSDSSSPEISSPQQIIFAQTSAYPNTYDSQPLAMKFGSQTLSGQLTFPRTEYSGDSVHEPHTLMRMPGKSVGLGLSQESLSMDQSYGQQLIYNPFFNLTNYDYSSNQPFYDTYALSGQCPPSTIYSYDPSRAVNPDWLQAAPTTNVENEPETSPDCPTSPLRSVVSSPESLNEISDPGQGLNPTLSAPDLTEYPAEGSHTRHRRKTTWAIAEMGLEHEVAVDDFHIGLQKEEIVLPGDKKDRRRVQNRLAQRAFRARSKIHRKEAATHMTDLQHLADTQADRIATLNSIVDRLQRENSALKNERWQEMQPHTQ